MGGATQRNGEKRHDNVEAAAGARRGAELVRIGNWLTDDREWRVADLPPSSAEAAVQRWERSSGDIHPGGASADHLVGSYQKILWFSYWLIVGPLTMLMCGKRNY